ncbi:MAG: phage virion morphogenesis protein [Deltaproteobacteria bacterium]|nr:phage virion morphogenesis protein [Deltaproteobacteria bacterium]
MSGVRGDDGKLRALMERLLRATRGEVAQQLRRELAKQTREEIDRAFRERRSPDGPSWKPRKGKGGAPLVESGALRSGFDVSATNDGVAVSNRVAYASVHQHGGRIRRRRRGKARKRQAFGARGGVIPARPMVPSSRWGPGPTSRLRAVASRVVRKFLHAG